MFFYLCATTSENTILRKITLFLILTFCISIAYSQRNVKDSAVSSFIFHAAYSFQVPNGDLTTYFGVNSTIGGGLSYKTDQNWLFSTTLNFIFGDQVDHREDILSMVINSDGEITDGNGAVTSLALFERGFHLQAKAGKIFDLLSPNSNSGIFVMGGIGYLQHRIRIEDQFGTAPQIMGDYAKGYDKLRGGFAVTGEMGYFMLSNSRVLNFSISAEAVHAFTKSLRDYDFVEMKYIDGRFSDTYLGIKVQWMIPTYARAPEKYYYD